MNQRITLFALLIAALVPAATAQVNSHEIAPGAVPDAIVGSSYAEVLMNSPAPEAPDAQTMTWCRPARVSDLSKSTVSGGTATVKVPSGVCPVKVSFSSYRLPGGQVRPFEDQELFDNKTVTLGKGTHTLRVNLPACAWQSDLYLGNVITNLIPNVGHPTDRIIAWSYKEDTSCVGASLGDRVWYDNNEDGLQNSGEGGVNGVKVTLFNSSDVQVAQQTTSGNGNYLFTGLAPGTYYIVVSDLPRGYRFTGQNGGSDESADSDVNDAGVSDPVVLTNGTHYRKLDAGIVPFGIYPTVAVRETCEGSYEATFGYFNEGPSTIEIPENLLFNSFLPLGVSQTTVFEPGRVEDAFRVTWNGGVTLLWWFKGPDGRIRSVSARAKDALPAEGCVCADPTSTPSYAGGYVLNDDQTRAFVEVIVPAGGTTFEFYNTRNLVVEMPENTSEQPLPGVTRAGNVFTFAAASPTTVRFPIDRLEPEVAGIAFYLRVTDLCGRTVDVDPAFSLAALRGQEVQGFGLDQNLPNPFAAHTTIAFTLDEAAPVRLTLYDVLGREVAVLADGFREAGRHTVRFDAAGLPAGQYLYRLDAGNRTLTRVMTLAR